MEPDTTLRVVELSLEQQFADIDVCVQLLSNLALERLRVRLASSDLAARKLPHSGQVRAFEPACDEERSVPFDHGRDDDDHDSTRSLGNERHMRVIGQALHFGFRAMQTVAPKSISPWLKSKTCL